SGDECECGAKGCVSENASGVSETSGSTVNRVISRSPVRKPEFELDVSSDESVIGSRKQSSKKKKKEKAERKRRRDLEKERVRAEKERENVEKERERECAEKERLRMEEEKRRSMNEMKKKESECVKVNADESMDVDERINVESVLSEARTIARGIGVILRDDANEVAVEVTERVEKEVARLEDLLMKMSMDNARMRGRLMERERMSECVVKVAESVSVMCEVAERVSKSVESMNEVCEKVRECEMSGVTKRSDVKQSFAVIVKGANEELTTREVKKRMNEAIVNDVNVCVKKVRPAKGGGVIVETATDRDRGVLTACPNFGQAGLRVERPRTMDPRVLVYDVPNSMSEAELMFSVYEKSVKDVISLNEFKNRARIVKRLCKEGADLANVIVEMP
ncbi:GRB10-interacting GYF protein 2-like, partial [Leptopilina boulardi]|uniref:GRB10-interacting GYF protein 2-like n=1 Tax=Leptopilina boulardi TaxID=63433 RepID=UPI0021F5C06E